MADQCPVVHPTQGAQCILSGVHAEHTAMVGQSFLAWPNADYVKPEPRKKWTPRPPRTSTKADAVLAQRAANEDAAQESSRWRTLLDQPSAPHNGTETSVEASEAIRSMTTSWRRKVFAVIADHHPDGITDEGIEQRLILKHQSASARRRELVLAGLIEPVGTAVNSSGARAQLWALTEEGQRALSEMSTSP